MTAGLLPSRRTALLLAAGLGGLALIGGYLLFERSRPSGGRLARLRSYWRDPTGHPEWTVQAGDRCPEAPFLIPSDGMIGFLWGDSFRPGHVHQGIDIFAPTGPDGLGETPVLAAYDGYITRQPDWRSALIQRVPEDPLRTGRQIWLYYTHMADPDGNSFIVEEFSPGIEGKFVTAGTRLGYQGNYSGDPDNPTGIHLHFSIVRDDGQGNFLNELEIDNTLDPSPYLGMELDADSAGDDVPRCPDPA